MQGPTSSNRFCSSLRIRRDCEFRSKEEVLDTSADICADYLIERPRQVRTVRDFLQLLDQRRQNPQLGDQIRALKAHAVSRNAVIVALSQISRAFDAQAGVLPGLSDVRLPNPLDLGLFAKACFLHEGECRLDQVA